MTLGSSVRHLEIPTFCITELSHAFQKLSDVCADWLSLQRRPRQKGHQRSSSGRLGQYCLWPRRRAANQRDELAAPHHSITSSACPSRAGGTMRSSALADLRLMIISTFVGSSTGNSPGLVPFRILSMYVAARR